MVESCWIEAQANSTIWLGTKTKLLYHSGVPLTPSGTIICCCCRPSNSFLNDSLNKYATHWWGSDMILQPLLPATKMWLWSTKFHKRNCPHKSSFLQDSIKTASYHVRIICKENEVIFPACIQIPLMYQFKTQNLMNHSYPKLRVIAINHSMSNIISEYYQIKMKITKELI